MTREEKIEKSCLVWPYKKFLRANPEIKIVGIDDSATNLPYILFMEGVHESYKKEFGIKDYSKKQLEKFWQWLYEQPDSFFNVRQIETKQVSPIESAQTKYNERVRRAQQLHRETPLMALVIMQAEYPGYTESDFKRDTTPNPFIKSERLKL